MADVAPRLLVIMGSGETSPTMSKVHRDLFDRLGPPPVPAVALDTPFGFQENADEVAAKAVAYFRESVRRDIGVASFRSACEIGTVEHETALARLAEARWTFAGPGSPSYALRQWTQSRVPSLLAEKLRDGGCVVLASAAAVTAGAFALPVYEIYKVGEPPHWLEGLDLLAAAGLRAAVIPHYNNAEGGRHDTRYCYVGERRLRMLEAGLPEGVFVLGVDEHTACVFDLEAGSASVHGRGRVTVRSHGVSSFVEAGETVPIGRLVEMARGGGGGAAPGRPGAQAHASLAVGEARSPLVDEVTQARKSFVKALESRDVRGAVAAILELDDHLAEWSRDTLESDELDRGRAAVRSMVVRLGEAAEDGVRDPQDVFAPFVDALLDARHRARDDGRWSDADAIRDRLLAAGIAVSDTQDGTEWRVR